MFVGEWDGKEVAVKVVPAGKSTAGLEPKAKARLERQQRMAELEAILMAVVSDASALTKSLSC